MSRATIKDVAAAAGVSPSAVSYILNGSDKKKYAEATVKAVRRAAEKLGYSPNRLARGMRSQKANAIGIVTVFEAESRILPLMLKAITEAASRLFVTTVLLPGTEDLSYVSAFRDRTVDGFVVIVPTSAPFNERAHVRALREAGAPFVVVNGTLHEEGMASATFDYYEASRLAVSHLLSLGRRRIAYVDEFSLSAARELRDRREGYMDTVREAGLLPRVYDLEHLAAEDLEGIEAVVTSRASTARALERRLLDAGIRVPTGIELLAGSAESAGGNSLPLACVEFPFDLLGEYAVYVATGREAGTDLRPSPLLTEGKTLR
ncbi:MAG: LacI family DNA-binding transcriptional regulator [Clostridia bacterium]|nr:LacI family DNA-binding transcriptional regulator [Clostridia bacterium]